MTEPSTRRSRAVGSAPFELLESKLQPPQVADGSVSRTALLQLLDGPTGQPIVVVHAGPGYGKTTLLAQWAGPSRRRRCAWVSAHQEDNDPVVLLSYIAAALDGVVELESDVFEALASPGASVEDKILPRLGHAMTQIETPFVLVIDDAHVIQNPQCIEAIVALAGHLRNDSRLALSTRDHSLLPLGRLRARGLLLELSAKELRMENDDARALLDAEGVEASDQDIGELLDRTEGWPAGLYLAALAARTSESGPGGVAKLTGKDRFVVEFLQSEFLASLPTRELEFLTKTSMLELLSGPLCDAMLQTGGSAAILKSLERSNRFVVALDRDGEWYRCHHLVRETLAGELAGSEPDRVSELLGRAADWCAANGQEVAAIRYGQAAKDVPRVASIMERAVLPVYQSGRATTVDEWFNWFESHSELESYPAVSVIGAMFHAATGRPTEAERWAVSAERGDRSGALPDGSESIKSWRALLRAIRSRDGVAAMTADAELAMRTLAPDSPWHPLSVVIRGISEVLGGAVEKADDLFADAAEEAKHLGAPDMLPIALIERAMIAVGREEWMRADGYAEHAVWAARRSRLEDSALNGLVYAVAARCSLRSGRAASAHDLLARAERLRPQLTYAIPAPAVQARVEMAYAHLELEHRAAGRTMLREAGEIFRRCPDLGILGEQVAELGLSLKAADRDLPGFSPLTEAELRVLPLLSTHLTFREIGEQLYLSRHTVKSHAMSIYRKLAVGSRGAAVERAKEIGLT
jgi:LuxR family transcriptional regulator, maltose regulon positive regulatory protein